MTKQARPAIPHGFKFFYEVADGYDFVFNGEKFFCSKKHCFMLAALAEVEWRKRAERWSALASLTSAFEKGKEGYEREYRHKRIGRYKVESGRCDRIARDWRAWGERK